MSTISPAQSADGETIEAADINNPINTIANEFNGNIEAVNLASNAVTTVKIANDAVAATKIDWASTGADGGIWWEELGRTTLGSSGDTITVSSIPARKYLRVLISCLDTGGTINMATTFNNDSGSNYSQRHSINGAAEATGTSQAFVNVQTAAGAYPQFATLDLVNESTPEKIGTGHSVSEGGSGAGTAPNRRELVFKWSNTSDQITRVDVSNTGGGSYDTGSEVVVLGHN